jgi:predicted ArsR family transcriptional regulator
VGLAYAEELAAAARLRRGADRGASLERLCRGLGELGFQASLESVSDDEAVVQTATCPLRPLVVADVGVRAIDEGMWRGLVEAVVQEERLGAVTCRTHDCLEPDAACRVVVNFRRSGRIERP